MQAKDFEFEVAHIGINQADAAEAQQTVATLCALFGFSIRDCEGSTFVNEQFEIMKTPFLGRLGHVAIRTNDAEAARAYLIGKGIAFQEDTASFTPEGRLNAIYFQHDIAGFRFHLLQKR